MHVTIITKLGPLGKNFSTRPEFGPDWDQADLDARVAAICGVPPDKCAAVAKQYFLEILQADSPRRVLNFVGLLRVVPTTGGTATTPDGFHTAEDVKADFSISYLPDVIHAWRATSTIEKTGDEGPAVPIIEAVLNALTNTKDTYTAAQNIHFLGDRLGFDKLNPNQGVFISTGENGPWVRLNTYGPITAKQIFVLIPAGTTGGLRLKVVNETNRESVYTIVIYPEQAPA